jgi:histone H3/H4
MNKDDANESLLNLIGELLYKNQLLREAIASKDEAIELIINHLMNAATSACSCGVANQLRFVRNTVKERDIELARRKRYCSNDFRNIVKYLIDNAANCPWDAVIRAAEK